MEIVIETDRQYLRKLNKNDFAALKPILGDETVMYAWEHGFSDDEIRDFIDENLMRYTRYGYSYYAAIDKKSGQFLGVAGVISETLTSGAQIGIGYIYGRESWHHGYAKEAAKACIKYAFTKLNAPLVCATIRPENTASRNVAERIGMHVEDEYVKHYRGKDMPHLIYIKRR